MSAAAAAPLKESLFMLVVHVEGETNPIRDGSAAQEAHVTVRIRGFVSHHVTVRAVQGIDYFAANGALPFGVERREQVVGFDPVVVVRFRCNNTILNQTLDDDNSLIRLVLIRAQELF